MRSRILQMQLAILLFIGSASFAQEKCPFTFQNNGRIGSIYYGSTEIYSGNFIIGMETEFVQGGAKYSAFRVLEQFTIGTRILEETKIVVFSCMAGRLAGIFKIKSELEDTKSQQILSILEWTPDFTNGKLVKVVTGESVFMNFGDPNGFFPDQPFAQESTTTTYLAKLKIQENRSPDGIYTYALKLFNVNIDGIVKIAIGRNESNDSVGESCEILSIPANIPPFEEQDGTAFDALQGWNPTFISCTTGKYEIELEPEDTATSISKGSELSLIKIKLTAPDGSYNGCSFAIYGGDGTELLFSGKSTFQTTVPAQSLILKQKRNNKKPVPQKGKPTKKGESVHSKPLRKAQL